MQSSEGAAPMVQAVWRAQCPREQGVQETQPLGMRGVAEGLGGNTWVDLRRTGPRHLPFIACPVAIWAQAAVKPSFLLQALRLAIVSMSFAALLDQRPSTTERPRPRRTTQRQHRHTSLDVDAKLELGERVQQSLKALLGEEQASLVAREASSCEPIDADDPIYADNSGSQPTAASERTRLPYGFWKRFVEEELCLEYTTHKRLQMYRAWVRYVKARQSGGKTRVAMRGDCKRGCSRTGGGALNAQKATGLGFMLLQFFVDQVQQWHCRADSSLLLARARELHEQLLREHWRESELPKLIGNAGKAWLWRWRKQYDIVKNVLGMKLKVSWAKVIRRVRVLLMNIFRLRAFWELLFPGRTMRWISLDQKPSWFNNAGHTGAYARKGSQPTVRENFNATRQRYSILTSVPSWGHGNPDAPPKVAVLFKGKPGGTIRTSIDADFQCPSWMMIQVQERGSYRSEDVVAALDWMLPPAACPEDSIIVLLDWYSGHRTEEVAELIRRKGHVLLFHGGGTTPFTQVNDTHLHALLARFMVQAEIELAFKQRAESRAAGRNETPTLKRPDILRLVAAVWLSIGHENVAAKGYRQTGPTMPLEGVICASDVYADLLGVLNVIDPSPHPAEVGTRMREEAVAFVRGEHEAGRLREWSDCYSLIEEQDAEDDPLVEGMEAFEPVPGDGEDDDGPGSDDGGEAPPGDGEPPAGSQPTATVGDSSVDGLAEDASIADASVAESSHAERLAQARQLLYEDAKSRNDDTIMRQLRKQMQNETRDQRAAATDSGIILRKRVHEQSEADNKRRREALERERLAANEAEAMRQATARAQEAAAKARLDAMREIIVNRRDAEARRMQHAQEKAYSRWLQTEYPAKLAMRLIRKWRALSATDKANFETMIREARRSGHFSRQLFIPALWETDDALTMQWAQMRPPWGGPLRWARCSLSFQQVIEREAPASHFGIDPCEQILRLFAACVPRARDIFSGPYTPARLLHMNDYVVEKAFVYGVVALSKWLGAERFPHGIYGRWPPNAPELAPSTPATPALDIDGAVPPHLRLGSPSASSGDHHTGT